MDESAKKQAAINQSFDKVYGTYADVLGTEQISLEAEPTVKAEAPAAQ